MENTFILNILFILSFYNLQASDQEPWRFKDIKRVCTQAIQHINHIDNQLDSYIFNDKIIENIYRIKIFNNEIDQSSQKYSEDESLLINHFRKRLQALINKHLI